MKRTARNRFLAMLTAVLVLLTMAGCDNPFNPLEESAEIKGLTYFDWAGTWERWDSDPDYDGFLVTLEYFNEFGDGLEFRDKPHTVRVEFYQQITVGGDVDEVTGEPIEGSGTPSFGSLLFTHETTFENTDDDIRIPVELYRANIAGALDEEGTEANVYIIVRLFPPKEKPQRELVLGYPDQIVFKEETTPTPNP